MLQLVDAVLPGSGGVGAGAEGDFDDMDNLVGLILTQEAVQGEGAGFPPVIAGVGIVAVGGALADAVPGLLGCTVVGAGELQECLTADKP